MDKTLSRRELLRMAGGAAATLMLGVAATGARANGQYPSKPITLVVPQPAGGDADTVCRLLQTRMQEVLGQTVIIENRGGAGGNIGVAYGARAPADGYTVTFVNQGILAFNPSLYQNIGFDPDALAPVTWMTTTDLVICAAPGLNVKDLKSFIELARQSPGKYTYGTAGTGSANHMAGKMLESMAGITLTHVPYKGGAAAIIDALGGQIDTVVAFPLGALPHIRSGKLKALAVTGAKRSSALPDVPTVAESGVDGYEFSSWFGLVVPKGTPAGVIERINQATIEALKVPATVARLREGMTEPVGVGPQEFAVFIKQETARWSGLIKKYGISAG